jgi:hypothetical protein
MAELHPYSALAGAQNEPSDSLIDGSDHTTTYLALADRSGYNRTPQEEIASHAIEADDTDNPLDKESVSETKDYDWNGSWTWEVVGAALSVVGFALLVGFLVKIGNTPYDSWRYTASPNTVISIIATITKAALLVPVSSCLGQLKWNQHNTPASAPLYHIQAIDQASRGPWGALDVLWRSIKVQKMNVLILVGAIITILALAVDPFAQQILTFPLRTVHDGDGTAWIQTALHYSMPETEIYSRNSSMNANYLSSPTVSAILGGLAQTNAHLKPHCSSGNCTYPSFVTLGICSHCEDVSDRTTQSCQAHTRSSEYPSKTPINDCTYMSPNGFSVQLNSSHHSWYAPERDSEPEIYYFADLWISHLLTNETIFGIQNPIVSFAAANQYQEILYLPSNRTEPPPKPSFTECAIYYCEKEFSFSTYSSTDQSGDFLNVSGTQQLTTNLINWKQETEWATDLYPPDHHYLLAENRTHYTIDENIYVPLRHTLSNIFNVTSSNPRGDNLPPGSLSLIALLRNGDLQALLQGVSTSLTDTLRASPGHDNKVNGEPYKIESYIHVRWPWIIFPASVVLGSVTLLLATVVVNKRQDNVLWKSSVLPLLMSDLRLAPVHEMWSLRSMDELQRVSENINATMHREKGRPVFTEK